jgi:hypothetical protein
METIQMLGSLGEFVGAIAVVATLVYLAIQVRHSKEAMEANTQSLEEGRKLARVEAQQRWTEMFNDSLIAVRESDYMPAIFYKRQEEGFDALIPEEQTRLWFDSLATITRLDNLLSQYQQGFLADDVYEHNFVNIVRGQIEHWREAGVPIETRRPAFQAEVERILAEEVGPS